MTLHHHPAGRYDPDACDPAEFRALIERTLGPKEVPLAVSIISGVPVYDAMELKPLLATPDGRASLLAEWAQVLGKSAGVFAIAGAYDDASAVDAATGVYQRIIAEETARNGGGADHFAKAGSNARVWNSLQKLCIEDPEVYLGYFSNPFIDAAAEAWLGPCYQMTAQINLVRPGGSAQQAHRDYHLGFQTAEVAMTFPAHVHDLSAALTLQGAVAHCDMPLESGPTKLLPFSQLYRPGYVAWRLPEFRAIFEEHHVQLPLRKGDALFFNPALFHAAGSNTSADIERMANLLQVSSAFGRAMETIDRDAMSKRVYPALRAAAAAGRLSAAQIHAVIASTAEGYSFPTNLDRDPPVDGLAPETGQAFMLRALNADMPPETFAAELDAMSARRLA